MRKTGSREKHLTNCRYRLPSISEGIIDGAARSHLNHGGPMMQKFGTFAICLVAVTLVLQTQTLYSKDLSFTLLDIQKLNRYDENRVLYQQYESPHNEITGDVVDNSIAALMIIKDKKVYLFEDGYDSPEQTKLNKIVLDRGNQMLPDMWPNKISNSPNFVLITDRKLEMQRNTTKEWVSNNYKDFYISVRDKFLKKHVSIFFSLIINRMENEISISRRRIPRKIAEGDQAKYITTVSARTPDGGTVYYAEDSDGDGITDIFTVNSGDDFQWGYGCGPNLVCIIHNTQKDIEKIIGRLANFAYNGSPAEEELIKKTFPGTDKINAMINDLYRIDADTERYLKKNNINIEDLVEKSSKGEGK